MKVTKLLFLLCSTFVLLVACQNNQSLDQSSREQVNIRHIQTKKTDDHQINQSVKQEFDQINELTTVIYNDELLMAIDVNQLAQFNEQKIEKEIESFIKINEPHLKPTVSSDYKIFLEINRLKQKIITEKLNSNDINKQFQSIKKLTETPGG